MAAGSRPILVEVDSDGDNFLCPICLDEDNAATYVLVLSQIPDLQLTCGHRFCHGCAEQQVKAGKCPNCRQEVFRSREDAFASMMYAEKKRYESEKEEYEKTRGELERKARLSEGESDRMREELALKLDAEMQRRLALEQQYREQEELSRALAAKQMEEKEQLLVQLKQLESDRQKAQQESNAERDKLVADAAAREALVKAATQELARKQERDRADLSQSVLDIRQRRINQENLINGQLEAQLERSRHGLHRSNPMIPPANGSPVPAHVPSPGLLHPHSSNISLSQANSRDAGDLPLNGANNDDWANPRPHGQLGDSNDPSAPGASSSVPNRPENDPSSPILQYSSAALRSISNAATSWSSQAWGLFGKLTQPLFSSAMSTRVRLGRAYKPNALGSSFVEFSAPKTVRKLIALPKYQPMMQNTHRITPEERNRNAEYFYRFREAMILSQVNHPNILRFYSPLVTPDQSIVLESPMIQHDLGFYSAEMLAGSPDEVLEKIRLIVTQLLLAVHYLHSLSVYHLNIKPTSVLIHQPTPQDGIVALLTAFSKARARGSHDSFVATLDLSDFRYALPYMSPQYAEVAENALAGMPSHRIEWSATDVWSVGCLLVSLLARGCDLFSGVRSASELHARARGVNTDALDRFVADSMRRRRRRHLPDLALAPQYPAAMRLATQLLQFDPSQRISAIDALHSPFIALHQDIVPPRVLAPFDDEALPHFALVHRGVPNRSEIIQPDD